MLFPIRKSPWQAIIASFATAIVITTFCLPLTNPYFAHAHSADSINQEDHNHPKLVDLLRQLDVFSKVEIGENEVESYEPNFAGLDRSIIGRVASGVNRLANNVPAVSSDLKVGDSHHWTFPKEVLLGPSSPSTALLPFEEESRQGLPQLSISSDSSTNNGGSPKNLYVTLSTCTQPKTGDSGGARQLMLNISTSTDDQNPNGDKNSFNSSEGFFAVNISASGDVVLTVGAPSDGNVDGSYTYELTASVDAPYAAYNSTNNDSDDSNKPFFFASDSDSDSTLLIANLTTPSRPEYQQWIGKRPPYSVFVHKKNDPAIQGIQNSLCGLKKNAQFHINLLDDKNASQTSIVPSLDSLPEQQLYVNGLDDSSSYLAILTVDGDGSSTKAGSSNVRGGGTVGKAITFNTKSDKNCALLFNLSFCSNVAYAVPSNPNTFPTRADLAKFYDDHASALYKNFSNSLQQIPCEAASTAQYSLAKNCTDCNATYVAWLCAVTIPRCADFSTPNSGPNKWLQPRNINQPFYNGTDQAALVHNPTFLNQNLLNASWVTSSRSKRIDDQLRPGPWKEVLPCSDLCYGLVQSCPAALGFACPLPGKGLEISYGRRQASSLKGGPISCNYPGKPWFTNAATPARALGAMEVAVFAAVATSVLLFWDFAL